MSSIEIYAEIGASHDGDYVRVLRLADIALGNGAVPKLQFWSSARRMVARRHAPQYEAVYDRYRVPEQWLEALRRRWVASEWPADPPPLACSVYLPEDVDTVAQYADVLKVSSFEAGDRVLLEAVRPHLWAGKRVVVSLGMGAPGHVVSEVLLRSSQNSDKEAARARLTYLHCTSAYPAPVSSLRLCRLWHGGDGLSRVGFSDHAPSGAVVTGALAVAAGACVVERHIRLDDTPEDNPDHPHSSPPSAFEEYCRLARLSAEAVGDWSEAEIPEETPMRAFRVGAMTLGVRP